MKKDNRYILSLSMFSTSSFTDETVLPATGQLRVYFDKNSVESALDSTADGTDVIVATDNGSFDLIKLSFQTDELGTDNVFTINGTDIARYSGPPGDLNYTWYSDYETDEYIDIDTQGFSSNKLEVSSIDSTYLSDLSILYEDMGTSTWTVTYDSNGGSTVDSEDVEDDSLATEPADPTRTNYKFKGWYSDAELTTPWDFTSDTVTEDLTLYAKWQELSPLALKLGQAIAEREFISSRVSSWGDEPSHSSYPSEKLVKDSLDAKANLFPETNVQDDDYTLVLSDTGKLILAGHATNAVKITIPTNSSVEFPVNTEIAIIRYEEGTVTIGTSDGATLNGETYTTTFEIENQYESVAIKKVGTDEWIMAGAFSEEA